MKITKSELREMIREALREELAAPTTCNKSADKELKESIWTCFFDDREVGTVEAATEEEAKEKMMDEYPEYHYGLYDGCFWVEPLTEGAMTGGQAEGGFRDTAKRPGGHTNGSGTNFKALDGKKTKTVKAKDLKPGMVTNTGKITKVTDIGWMNGKPSVEVSYGGIGAGGSYASDVVEKDRDYDVLDESLKEAADVLDVSASEVDNLARDVFVDFDFESAYAADGYVVGEAVETLIVDVLSDEYPNMVLGSVPDRVASALENMIATGLLG